MFLGMDLALAQQDWGMCPAGSTAVYGGGGTMCQCPDGSYAGMSGCQDVRAIINRSHREITVRQAAFVPSAQPAVEISVAMKAHVAPRTVDACPSTLTIVGEASGAGQGRNVGHPRPTLGRLVGVNSNASLLNKLHS